MMGSAQTRSGSLASGIMASSLVVVVALLLYMSGRPLATNDLWWHLKMGEVYATEGPWPEADPLLHTAHEDAPIQHEWLFDVAIHGVDRWLGLQGIRVVHVLAVVGILWLAFSIFRRESRSRPRAWFALLVFIGLASWRLGQMRPDLVSIPATFLLYRLLLEGEEPPSWKRVSAASLLLWVWVNAHSLFGIGILLLLSGILGSALRAMLALRMPQGCKEAWDREWARTRRLAGALGLGFLVTLLNPRGVEQHLTFLTSSRESAIWAVFDEWMHFDPFSWKDLGTSVGPVEWALTNLVFGAFLVVGAICLFRLLRRPSPETLHAGDPVLLGLGMASLVAGMVSVRFLWMCLFPLLLLLRAEHHLSPRSAAILSPVLALLSLTLAVAYPTVATVRKFSLRVPGPFSGYFSQVVSESRFFPEGVRFLDETQVEGNLFNTYPMGGYLAYWLAPRVRTFIDGRTEHYPASVYEEYIHITQMKGTRPGESYLGLLDRRGVDLFFGVGVPPTGPARRYTSAHLEGAPGWILVSRSKRHGIYLRENQRNRENLRRITEYYQREGVPFDPAKGLDVMEVLEARPDWAVSHGMVPINYSELLEDRTSADPPTRFRALQVLGFTYALLGAYQEQVEVDLEAAFLQPRAKGPLRRLVFGLLRLDRPKRAQQAARSLYAIDPDDPVSKTAVTVARLYQQRRADLRKLSRKNAGAAQEPPPQALLSHLTL